METKQHELYQAPVVRMVEVNAENIICGSETTSATRQDYGTPIEQNW